MRQLNMDEIQQIQLRILEEVHSFCIKNDITYFLTGGSLIGAVRHNGYIPWDDDIDIAMFRDDYENFLKEFNKVSNGLHAYSIIHDKGYNLHFAKICDTTTILKEADLNACDVELGIGIDLFPYDKLPINIDGKKILHKLHNIDKKMHGLSFRDERIKTRPYRQRLLIYLYRLWAGKKTKKYYGQIQADFATKYRHVDTEWYSSITCHFRKDLPHFQRKNTIPVLHQFENLEVFIPSNYDDLLKQQYGDYLTLPPEKERVNKHGLMAWKN